MCHKKESEFIELRRGNLIVVGYETKFTQLSRFASDHISTRESKVFYFQEGLSQFWKDNLFLHKLEIY